MATIVTLPQGVIQAYVNVNAVWSANTLATSLASFAAALNGQFVESNHTDHPIGNWLAVIAALAANMPTTGGSVGNPAVPFSQASDAAKWVAGICTLATELASAPQAAAIIAAYNLFL